MVFVVLEGFSGTGKTTIAKGLERQGWLRLTESAHAVPREVALADRAGTFEDYSLLGASMVYSGVIAKLRNTRNIVSEGFVLSDLAYARIRYDLGKSKAFPGMMSLCKMMLEGQTLRPDVYFLLKAREDTIEMRQGHKKDRDKNLTEFFRTRYYSALAEIHNELGETNVQEVYTDSDKGATLAAIQGILRERKVA